jgi:cytochrome c oxidase assembly factor CtaG
VGSWTLDVPGLAVAALSLALYAQGFRRLRRRGGRATRTNAGLFLVGITAGTLAVVSPLDELADRLLSAHMAQHVILGDVMPMLLVLGARGPMTVFFLPRMLLVWLARRRRFVWLVARLMRPRVAFALWLVSAVAWHLPPAYDLAVANPAVHALEHLTFAFAGVLVWAQILDPARRGHLSEGARAAFAAAVLLVGMALAEVLVVLHPIYSHYIHVTGRPFGWTAAQDQARAGFVMMAEQLATLGIAAALLLWDHIERVGRELETSS